MQAEYCRPDGPLRVPSAEDVRRNVHAILIAARSAGVPAIHVRHISRGPSDPTFGAGSPGVRFMEGVTPDAGEYVITKTRPGAFHMTELDDVLRGMDVETVVICGLLSFMCCDTTAREAHARGYKVLFVKDATAALDVGDMPAAEVHAVTCAVQGWLFSEVISTDQAIARLRKIS